MSSSSEKPDPFDPFGIVASMEAWCCLLEAAREIRNVDQEMMMTMLKPKTPGPAPVSAEAAAKLRSIVELMRSLNLDPDAIRQRQPAAMRALEAACLDCRDRSRCARALRAGTAAATYREFCPNGARLDQLKYA
ncbi:heavy-metal resistance [Methylobacterium goesingense]|uniref:Heavy-metal resistance n=1 Tax=Methylobacterium goesingense TaxID=243690 RepID=A0ABV2LC61_9HYPH|nr:heavy-metal resistance [Methylobacterium goesingense]GJD76364.1 hypothetical protein CFIICLFH_4620 [Methylobacterium goesingense]